MVVTMRDIAAGVGAVVDVTGAGAACVGGATGSAATVDDVRAGANPTGASATDDSGVSTVTALAVSVVDSGRNVDAPTANGDRLDELGERASSAWTPLSESEGCRVCASEIGVDDAVSAPPRSASNCGASMSTLGGCKAVVFDSRCAPPVLTTTPLPDVERSAPDDEPARGRASGVCEFADGNVNEGAPGDDVVPVEVDPDGPGDDESDPGVSAAARPYPVATAAPTPSATANPPTRPI